MLVDRNFVVCKEESADGYKSVIALLVETRSTWRSKGGYKYTLVEGEAQARGQQQEENDVNDIISWLVRSQV